MYLQIACITCLTISVIFLLYYYLISPYNYWKNRKVPGPKPTFFFGNTKNSTLLRTTIGENLQEIYKNHINIPFLGIYELWTPVLLFRDINLIKKILIKDFSHFNGRGIVMNEKADPLCANLINLTGPKWRILRSKLTPAFTSGKIRKMFEIINESSNKFKIFISQYADIEESVEFRNLAAKFTTDIISTCCFGLETNSIQNDDSTFRSMCRKVLDPSLMISLKRVVRWYLPKLFMHFGMSLTPKEVSNYFLKLVNEMIQYREDNNIVRHDIMQLLMQLKHQEKSLNPVNSSENQLQTDAQPVFDNNTIAAQAYIFFLAGFETSSTTMSFAMYELALNPSIQAKLHAEIYEILSKYNGEINYDAILEMDYLDRVIRETLRKYPPVGVIPRVCNKAYLIPGTNVTIEKNIKVLIPIHAIHHDENYYPNPSKFDPDRFLNLDSNKEVHGNCIFLPFGEGPRICIGTKFAYMQTKVGLVTLLQHFKVCVSPKTTIKLDFDPTANILTSKSGIWLKINRRHH